MWHSDADSPLTERTLSRCVDLFIRTTEKINRIFCQTLEGPPRSFLHLLELSRRMVSITTSIPAYIGSDVDPLENGLRLATAASNYCLWEWDLSTGEISRSEEMVSQFGYELGEIRPDTDWWRERIHPDDRARAAESMDRAIGEAPGSRWTCNYRFRRRDGGYAQVCDHAFILRDPSGQAVRVVGAVMDLTELHHTYHSLKEREEWYRHTIELTGQIAWSASANGQIIKLGTHWTELTGFKNEMTIPEWEQVAHPADYAHVYARWDESVRTGAPLDLEQRLRIKNGTYRWFRTRAAAYRNRSGAVECWYGTIEDIHKLKTSQLALTRLANFDELTTFPNRHMFTDDLEAALSRATEDDVQAALLLIDLDDFKSVNDMHGHSTGDLLLMSFARRMLKSGIRLYRVGGDEFAAIVDECPSSKSATDLADQIHSLLEKPFQLSETSFECRTSIGCAIFPWHGNDATELLKSADLALYAAKDAGRAQTKVFISDMRANLQRRSSMLEVARQALDLNTIVPFFQPKIRLADGRVVGFEALMRVQSERFGAQAPSIIGEAFNHPELCLAIAERMLSAVMSVIKDWRSRELGFGRIALNASPHEFRRGDYADRLLSCLEAEGVSPRHIEVEVTENVFIEHREGFVLDSLLKLKKAGVTIALDDFGTGYASLSHLRHFPVDVLKIDRSFIRGLTTDARQERITKGLIELSHTIGIQTVAEGVETAAQAALLQSFGCDLGQGFLFGRAAAAHDAEELLKSSCSPPVDESALEFRSA